MKIAFYSQDGLDQVILTPESKTETAILGKLHDDDIELSVKHGTFYECVGGWVRESQSESSTMLVMRPRRSEGE